MLQVVIDTSALVSYVLTQGKLMSQVVEHWRSGAFRLLSSTETRRELVAVLNRPSIQRLAVTSLTEFALGVERFSHHVPGELTVTGACRDSKDDKFLACAVEGAAHYLISSDHDLLSMRHFRNVAIVNPGQFLVAMELYAMDATTVAERFDRKVLETIWESIPLEPETATRVLKGLQA